MPIPAMVTQLPALEPAAPAVTTVEDAVAPDLVADAFAEVAVVLVAAVVLLAAAALLVVVAFALAAPLDEAAAALPLRAASSARSAWGMGGRKFWAETVTAAMAMRVTVEYCMLAVGWVGCWLLSW
jgi:hypothetical protein